MRIHILYAALCWIALLASSTRRDGSGTSSMCSIVVRLPYMRDEATTSFLATTLPASLNDTTHQIAWRRSGEVEPLPLRPGTHPVVGQLVRVRVVRGAMADAVSSRLAAGDSTAVIVRWAVDPMCSPVFVGSMLAQGELDYFIGALRPPGGWIEGHPTLDITVWTCLTRWCIYPHVDPGALRQDASPSYRGSDSTNMLDVFDFAAFYETLPTARELNHDCQTALKPVERWAENHNSLSPRYPVALSLRELASACDRLSARPK